MRTNITLVWTGSYLAPPIDISRQAKSKVAFDIDAEVSVDHNADAKQKEAYTENEAASVVETRDFIFAMLNTA